VGTIGENGCQHIAVKGVSDAVIIEQRGEGSGGLQEPPSFRHDQNTRQGDLEAMSGEKHYMGRREQVGEGFRDWEGNQSLYM
jgi:hypothetical protein